jgi:predicted nuclease of predicted toxin-antitoxin system
MRFLADENFPRPALEALRKAGWDVVSIAEECPGVPDEDVAALCAAQERILLTFDKDFGELVFHRGLPAGSGVVLFRITPDSPEDAADVALALVQAQPDLAGSFCVVTRDRIRIRPLSAGSGR